MSSQVGFVGAGKKAVHVKWAGKTIALGTFASAEADEKCARAKALTRAWRSTMRPKPTREWVMAELERLGVRVVSGRLGRKAGEEDEPEEKKSSVSPAPTAAPVVANVGPTWSSSASELDNIIQRRNSSLGLSMMSDRDFNRRGSLGSLGLLGFDSNDPMMPPHRPLVGGGSAAAYEAARADHYAQKREEQVRRASLTLAMGGGNVPMGGLSVNPNQHYEMLKLHHMNLLNEIQETTLMMNLYQQQQLQQQQQQLQQRQASVEGMLTDIGGSRRSLSLGSLGGDSAPAPAPKKSKSRSTAATPTAKKPRKSKQKDASSKSATPAAEATEMKGHLDEVPQASQMEHEQLEAKLKKIKEEIASREKEAEELQKRTDSAGENSKTSAQKDESESDEGNEDESDASSR